MRCTSGSKKTIVAVHLFFAHLIFLPTFASSFNKRRNPICAGNRVKIPGSTRCRNSIIMTPVAGSLECTPGRPSR